MVVVVPTGKVFVVPVKKDGASNPKILGMGVLTMISMIGDSVKGEGLLFLAKTTEPNDLPPCVESSMGPLYLFP